MPDAAAIADIAARIAAAGPAELRGIREALGISLRAIQDESRRRDPSGRGFSLATLSRWETLESRCHPFLLGQWRTVLASLAGAPLPGGEGDEKAT